MFPIVVLAHLDLRPARLAPHHQRKEAVRGARSDDLERSGDFSKSTPFPTDPVTKAPFTGNKIGVDKFDRESDKLGPVDERGPRSRAPSPLPAGRRGCRRVLEWGVAGGAGVKRAVPPPVNPLTVDGATVNLSHGGQPETPCTISFTDGDREVVIEPHAPLQDSTVHAWSHMPSPEILTTVFGSAEWSSSAVTMP